MGQYRLPHKLIHPRNNQEASCKGHRKEVVTVWPNGKNLRWKRFSFLFEG